ncbi:MAG: HAD family hydrolase [Candidatus Omnitrophica bacterium]|nr:HAD family hydrolase [Candidatus Omnitrophota bacterium]
MQKVKAIFLDRDGVVNEYPGHGDYVKSPDEFRLLPGAVQALEELSAAGFRLFIVSNQAGVAKGLYTDCDLRDMDDRLQQALAGRAKLDGIYYCTHRKEEDCPCRKPKTGLIDKAVSLLAGEGLSLDRSASFFIGDSIPDMETGRNAGLTTILVFSGKEKPQNHKVWTTQPDRTAQDLSAAARAILRK